MNHHILFLSSEHLYGNILGTGELAWLLGGVEIP